MDQVRPHQDVRRDHQDPPRARQGETSVQAGPDPDVPVVVDDLVMLPVLEPEDVAERIVRAIRRNKRRVVMPWSVHLLPLMRVLPIPLLDALAGMLGVNTSMDDFVGRDSGRSTR